MAQYLVLEAIMTLSEALRDSIGKEAFMFLPLLEEAILSTPSEDQ